ncbi:HNH endonuclease [Nocardia sp. NPDC004260]
MAERKKQAIPNAVRREVCRAAGAEIGRTVDVQCAYCDFYGSISWSEDYRYWPVIDGLELHHVIPEFHGGPTSADNITLACRSCNRSKGHRI